MAATLPQAVNCCVPTCAESITIQIPGPPGADGAPGVCPPCESSGGQQVFSGHYGGVAPLIVPTGIAATADDLDVPNNHWVWNPDTLSWF